MVLELEDPTLTRARNVTCRHENWCFSRLSFLVMATKQLPDKRAINVPCDVLFMSLFGVADEPMMLTTAEMAWEFIVLWFGSHCVYAITCCQRTAFLIVPHTLAAWWPTWQANLWTSLDNHWVERQSLHITSLAPLPSQYSTLLVDRRNQKSARTNCSLVHVATGPKCLSIMANWPTTQTCWLITDWLLHLWLGKSH